MAGHGDQRLSLVRVHPMKILWAFVAGCFFGCAQVAAIAASDDLVVTTMTVEAGAGARAAESSTAYRVVAFELKGRWSGAVVLPLRNGDLWTAEKQSEVLQAIRTAFETEESSAYLFSQATLASVLYVDVDEQKDDATHTVKLTFRPLQVHLSMAKVGDNVLPIPRSPYPTRYEAVPRPLLALHPDFGVSRDRAFGTAVVAAFASDLLAMPDLINNRLARSGRLHHLDARFKGERSDEGFYRTNTALTYAYRPREGAIKELSFRAGYDDTKEPLAGREHRTNTSGTSGGITFRVTPHMRVTLNAGYERVDSTLEQASTRLETETEVQSNRVVIESLLPRPIGGFFRAAIWEDNGRSDQGLGSHQRLVTRAGYAREFAVSPNQTIGLELLGGAGQLWGNAPAVRRFFGGNSAGQFLYDGVADATLRNLPAGPLLRSFGQGEATGSAGGNGGTAFWHVNANLTFPIRGWSFPLIPPDNEVRGRLKNGIYVSGRNMLISSLKNQGLTRDAAVAEADRTLDEIRPATDYIIDEANLYSIKPLLMFDAAGLSGDGRRSWLAAGAGVQLNVVSAKFELGYMRTLRGSTIGDRGNLFLRLVFQNLF